MGLVTGTCLAETVFDVTCVDIDTNKIKYLRDGSITIYEPGLELIMRKNTEKGRLHFTISIEENIDGIDAIFIAVGTPPEENGSSELQYVIKAG